MDSITNIVFSLGFGLFLLLLTGYQIYTKKTGGRTNYTLKDFKTIRKEDNPTAFKIRVYTSLLLGLFFIFLGFYLFFFKT